MKHCKTCYKPLRKRNKSLLCKEHYLEFLRTGEIPEPKPRPRITDVITLVCEAFLIDRAHIVGPSRSQRIMRARQAAYFLARKFCDRSYPVIGAALGGRDHSTVIHGVGQCELHMERDPEYRAKVERIDARLTGFERTIEVPKIIFHPKAEPRMTEAPILPDDAEWNELDELSRRVSAYYERSRAA